MIQRLLSTFQLLFWPVLIALLLVQCKKAEEATVTPTTPTTPPTSTTTAPPLTDAAKTKTGLLPLSVKEYEQLPIYVAKSYKGGRKQVLTAVDLSAEMPPVGDQGPEGSCQAWAAAYAMRSYLYHQDTKKSYKLADGTRDDDAVFSPAYVYNQVNDGKDAGTYPTAVYALLIKDGVCTFKTMPYKVGYPNYLTQPTADQKQNAANFKIAGFGRTLITQESLKACLTQGTAIQVSIRTDPNLFEPSDQVAGEYVWKKFDAVRGSTTASHALVLMGFDDSKNAFKLMNSWGSGWANKGFIWLDYGLISQVITEAYIPYTTSTLAQLAVYDPSATVSGSGIWTQKATAPGVGRAEYNDVTFVIDNLIYTVGSGTTDNDKAWQGKAEMYAYNPTTDQWTKKANLPAQPKNSSVVSYEVYKGMAAFVIGRKAYLVAGAGNEDYNSRSERILLEYDPDKDAWTQKKNLPFDKGYARFSVVTFGYNGKGYFGLNPRNSGGVDQVKIKQERELWEYDPTNDSWLLKTSVPDGWKTGTTQGYGIVNDKLYLIMASTTSGMLTYEYDLRQNMWARKSTLTTFDGFNVGPSGVLNGKLYYGLTRGYVAGKDVYNSFFAYDPATDKWDEVKAFPQAERYGMIGRVVGNKMYVGFGTDAKLNPILNEWWMFTP